MWPLFGLVIVAVVSRAFFGLFLGRGPADFTSDRCPLFSSLYWPVGRLFCYPLSCSGRVFICLALFRLFLAEPVIVGRFRLLFGRSIVPVY